MKQLLLDLNNRGVKLRLDGDELRGNAPPGALIGALRSALLENMSAERLERALCRMIARHDMLRTVAGNADCLP